MKKDNTNKLFLIVFPILIPFFNPTKEWFFNGVSLPELFLCLFILNSIIVLSIKEHKIIANPFLGWTILIILLVFLSYFIKLQPDSQIKHPLRFLEYTSIFIIFYNVINNLKDFKLYLNSCLVSLMIVSLYTFVQYFFPIIILYQNWGPSKLFDSDTFQYNLRWFSFLDNPLNLLSFISLLLGMAHYRLNNFVLKTIVLLITYSAIIFTGSKGGLIIISISFLFLLYEFKKKSSTYSIVFIVLFLFVGIPFFLTKVDVTDSVIYKRIDNSDNYDASVIQRLYAFDSSIDMIVDNPILGVGAGNYGIFYDKKGYRNQLASTDDYTFTSENFFLQFYLEYGLIPFIYLLFLIRKILKGYLRNRMVLPLAIGVILYLIVGLTTNLFACATQFMFFSILGVSLKLLTFKNNNVLNNAQINA